jgi:hypothetical protein
LIDLKTTHTDNVSKLESLTNYKQASVKEIDKKNSLLKNAEMHRKNAADQVDIIKYQV